MEADAKLYMLALKPIVPWRGFGWVLGSQFWSDMSDITAERVAHLAHLARIGLTQKEVDSLTVELQHIVDAVATVTEVATPDIPATSHPIPLQNVFREDIVGNTLTAEQALSGAPERTDNRFTVSAILGEEP